MAGKLNSVNEFDNCLTYHDISGIANVSMMPPPPNLKRDLHRLGLEYTVADMSLSALYLHELHHRSSQTGIEPRTSGIGTSSQATPVSTLDYRLNDLKDVSEEECIPLFDSENV